MVKNDMLDLDLSFLLILALIWILMLIMDRIFFRPVGETIRHREAMVADDERRLNELNTEINAGAQRIETSLQKARLQSVKTREELIAQGEAAREELIAGARQQTRQIMDREMERLEREIHSAEVQLQKQAGEFSRQISRIFQ